MTISTHVLAFLIGLIYPSYFLFTYQKTNNRIRNNESHRLVDYKQSIFIFWGLTLFVIGNEFIPNSMSLNFYPTFNIPGIILATLILIFVGLQMVTSRISTVEKAKSVIEKMKDNYFYLPKSKREFVWFSILSLSAGLCEEIIFRLFMFSYLSEITNLVIAFILTNVVFALTHISSGKQNMISAFILGLLFTGIYFFTNNIWLSIILHSAIDMNAGFLGYHAQVIINRNVVDEEKELYRQN